ncbi:bifunctional [glutamine synthetase] adenylyltransferase/[glutamine synthetase]-adenylyl-L-tyrosine phosphorylase [Rhizobium sp. SSA_523]|uniref:bifunctional [glutamine synthetase] adenylyltransferase/[glutamine synthetase]-adenylyl-L-tyrosine phosphorylase n=1 Tax=Rhizobium sp. SSA_523 TaxID=2952477 RepID=UPI002090B096|nr:bifunctional [glutamine synthetase] adenylyltransferase/[glutamine synthetase]-adenylyl-L-tyrosine phosphorylase [Rhizobium sp. SSA_523]MCO5730885.1 bifunctional [glutamine synthetase] adenylyltransferase/[glutamine synthetase]-adenylyl-L-tyrosine phosphorylase [Rhizobium sp. SSA_523]WKC24299.1 bifunctional [glutamine synthetase] adenylyltransferase/[glutamine synthetase]-adenylyl-L-tyrosine phosphorylase [Rhizobium sp. SSA_523]
MSLRRLADLRENRLKPFNQTEAKAALATLREIAADQPPVAEMLAEAGVMRDFLCAALSLSPYLRELASLRPAMVADVLAEPFETLLERAVTTARDCWRPSGDGSLPGESEVMAALRRAKARVSFLLALADLAGLFKASETTGWLTRLADAAVAAAIDHLLLAQHQAGKLSLHDPAQPSKGSGLIVLGMGKLGACELNYSSDIDIVIFFDPEAGIVADKLEATEFFGRMMRRLIRILQERTGDGYVFRTDLRLRPDPGSTPLAVPMEAALIYYEGRGQNWERAAYIKARPMAGDLDAGEAFLRQLVPFVYRKYLDYAAIADIHSIKRQIHAHKGHGAIAVKGHDVKLGRGGIREIEFFAQTQQLIAGGRMPDLRQRQTEKALAALAEASWIRPDIASELTKAYWFLRDVEHRIQMVRDEQSHRLPETETELKRIAYMLGFADTAQFSDRLVEVLRLVERRYAELFEQEAKLSAGEGNLVFTGQNDDPETLNTLSRLGFERPADMSRVIRTWHNGRYRATQSVEARERLTELMPDLLTAFGRSKRADDALLRFDGFLKALPAGIQLFSLLGNNPGLLSLMVMIMAAAPRLADIIAARPHVFDGMLDPGLMAEIPTRYYLAERLETFVGGARHYEDSLDRLRIFTAEQRFLIGIRLLTGAISGTQAGRAFTDLADLVIEQALAAVLDEMAQAHGDYPGGRVAIMGMGKLGSYELTAGSDVDLILLYDYEEGAQGSDGAKPIDASRYFTRVTQRLIAALSAPTAEGIVFEVDLRLRPSGNKGPVATRINAFRKYQQEEAWTWEHMALSRARMVCGEPSLVQEAEAVIAETLAAPRDRAKIAADVADMRALIEKEKPPGSGWDMKLIPGGLIDIEFLAQYARLVAPDANDPTPGSQPESGTATALRRHGQALLSADDLDTCVSALSFYTELSQIIRLCVGNDFDEKDAPAGLIERLCTAADQPTLKLVEAEIKRRSKAVRSVFQACLSGKVRPTEE